MTARFIGHPAGVAKQLRKVRARDARESRCIESLLLGLVDEEFKGATRVCAVYHIQYSVGVPLHKLHTWDKLTINEAITP